MTAAAISHGECAEDADRTEVRLRPYRAEDRTAVRRICADTGFLGQPIDPLFEDRELFADYLTGYYTRFEPDALLVCEVGGQVRGYLMGCRRPLLKQVYQFLANGIIGVRALYRCFSRPYNPASRAFIRWILLNSWREVPAAPRYTPHFHINVLPGARSVKSTRALIQTFLKFLREKGHRQVYGQMICYPTRRNESLFNRYGFRLIGRAEITKYRPLYSGQVLLSTVIKEL
jgi:hypothetical protein